MASTSLQSIVYMSEAACLAAEPCLTTAVISITEPGRTAPLPRGWGAVPSVQFVDAEFDVAMLQRLAQRGRAVDLNQKGYPCRERCASIHAFLARIAADPSITDLIVHCHAGQRRSAAVAKFAAERLDLPSTVGDTYNRTVYALLRDPACFDHQVAK